MGNRRHLSRQLAAQLLYAAHFQPGVLPGELLTRLCETDLARYKDWTPFCQTLVRQTLEHEAELDAAIGPALENWRLERMPIVDRNILRMAIYEMKSLGTPPAVVIDEALELARRYSEEEAVPFVNGVLDAIRKILFPEGPVSASN